MHTDICIWIQKSEWLRPLTLYNVGVCRSPMFPCSIGAYASIPVYSTASQPPCLSASQPPCLSASLPPYLLTSLASLPPCLPTSLPLCLSASLPPCLYASLPLCLSLQRVLARQQPARHSIAVQHTYHNHHVGTLCGVWCVCV
jgi:hypothetical protein